MFQGSPDLMDAEIGLDGKINFNGTFLTFEELADFERDLNEELVNSGRATDITKIDTLVNTKLPISKNASLLNRTQIKSNVLEGVITI